MCVLVEEGEAGALGALCCGGAGGSAAQRPPDRAEGEVLQEDHVVDHEQHLVSQDEVFSGRRHTLTPPYANDNVAFMEAHLVGKQLIASLAALPQLVPAPRHDDPTLKAPTVHSHSRFTQ